MARCAHELRPAARAAPLAESGARPPPSLYLAAPLSMGYVDFFTFLIPLYGLSLGFDASEIGILVGARSILALFLSIHIGVLMDRFGTRAVTLVFVWTGMAIGATVSAGDRVLGVVAIAIGQRRRGLLRLVGRADPDRPARRRRRPVSRQIHLLRPARLDLRADRRRGRLGFRRRLAGLPRRLRLGCGTDDRADAHAGGGIFPAAAGSGTNRCGSAPRRLAPASDYSARSS